MVLAIALSSLQPFDARHCHRRLPPVFGPGPRRQIHGPCLDAGGSLWPVQCLYCVLNKPRAKYSTPETLVVEPTCHHMSSLPSFCLQCLSEPQGLTNGTHTTRAILTNTAEPMAAWGGVGPPVALYRHASRLPPGAMGALLLAMLVTLNAPLQVFQLAAAQPCKCCSVSHTPGMDME